MKTGSGRFTGTWSFNDFCQCIYICSPDLVSGIMLFQQFLVISTEFIVLITDNNLDQFYSVWIIKQS